MRDPTEGFSNSVLRSTKPIFGTEMRFIYLLMKSVLMYFGETVFNHERFWRGVSVCTLFQSA